MNGEERTRRTAATDRNKKRRAKRRVKTENKKRISDNCIGILRK